MGGLGVESLQTKVTVSSAQFLGPQKSIGGFHEMIPETYQTLGAHSENVSFGPY